MHGWVNGKGPEGQPTPLLLSACLFTEASGEPFHGKLAVGEVVLNRAFFEPSWWGRDIRSVLLCKWQFEGLRKDNASWQRLERCLNGPEWTQAELRSWLVCQRLAGLLYSLQDEWTNNSRAQVSNFATHYCTKRALEQAPTGWIKKVWREDVKPSLTLGNHVFFKLGPSF